VPVNRWLIARGKVHAAVHHTGIHGGPNPKLVGALLAFAFVFGTATLIAEAISHDGSKTVRNSQDTSAIAGPSSAVPS
jgi:hypothetical protein